jgi:hypothetical protein
VDPKLGFPRNLDAQLLRAQRQHPLVYIADLSQPSVTTRRRRHRPLAKQTDLRLRRNYTFQENCGADGDNNQNQSSKTV